MTFGTIIADPPWEYVTTTRTRKSGPSENSDKLSGYSDMEYRPLSTDDLCGLDVKSLAAEDSVLLLWTTFPHIPAALNVIDTWGYKYVTGLGWAKTIKDGSRLSYGVGYWFRGCIELVLVGKRGKSYRTNERGGYLSEEAVHVSPPLGHSIKPDFLHEIAEKHFPGPRLEMFGRRSREGWTVIGNGAPGYEGEDIRDSLRKLLG
jgi:N6-adenosine-specific RNA methylase IME4